jgi:hypothetical protein
MCIFAGQALPWLGLSSRSCRLCLLANGVIRCDCCITVKWAFWKASTSRVTDLFPMVPTPESLLHAVSEAHQWGSVGPYNPWLTPLLLWSRSHEQWLSPEITSYVPMISVIHRTSHMETSDDGKMGQGTRFPSWGVLLDAAWDQRMMVGR